MKLTSSQLECQPSQSRQRRCQQSCWVSSDSMNLPSSQLECQPSQPSQQRCRQSCWVSSDLMNLPSVSQLECQPSHSQDPYVFKGLLGLVLDTTDIAWNSGSGGDSQVWPLTHFFLFPFCKKLLISLESMIPCWKNYSLLFLPPIASTPSWTLEGLLELTRPLKGPRLHCCYENYRERRTQSSVTCSR